MLLCEVVFGRFASKFDVIFLPLYTSGKKTFSGMCSISVLLDLSEPVDQLTTAIAWCYM